MRQLRLEHWRWRSLWALGPVLALALVTGACGDEAGLTDAGAAADAAIATDGDPWAKEPPGATARYDLTSTDWHAAPFPSDVRRSPTHGQLDLKGFPPSREGKVEGKLEDYLNFAAAHLSGWSVQPTVYVQFDAPLDPALLPKALATVQAESLVQLVDVDPTSPDHGKRIPLLLRVSGKDRGQHLAVNLLMAQPTWGLPLRPKTTYAFVVRRGLRDAAGKVLGQPQALRTVLDALLLADKADRDKAVAALAEKPRALATSLAPLAEAMRAGKVAIAKEDLAAATVLTTGDPTAQLVSMAAWVRDKAPLHKLTNWEKVSAKDPDYVLITAMYKAPNFQMGECPHDGEGEGGFQFDAKGDPVVQRWEEMRVAIAVPKLRPLDADAVGPGGGKRVPVVLSAHGTGGDWLSFANSSGQKIGSHLTGQGLAVVSIDQPLHGPRCSPALTGALLDFKTFNFLNIAAGRSGFRQSALDTVFLARLVREGYLDVPADVGPNGASVTFDNQRLQFIGHSQGGLSGALVAAIDPTIRAFVLSGAGAGLSLTVMLRKDPADIAVQLSKLLGLDDGEVSEFHPIVSLVQALSDITDPLSYGRLVFQRPVGVAPPHVLLTEGEHDAATPSATAEALAAAIGLQVLAPVVHLNDAMQVMGLPVLDSPVAHNLVFGSVPVTGVVSQWAGADHFVIFKSAKAADLYTEFLVTTATDGKAVAWLP